MLISRLRYLTLDHYRSLAKSPKAVSDAPALARSGIAKNISRPVISHKLLVRLRFQSHKAPNISASMYEYTPITQHTSIMWGKILITTYRVKSTHFFIYALLFREQARPSPRFFFSLPFVSYLIFFHSPLYSSLNACFISSFILQKTQFQMQCFLPYKYMRTRCFHGKTWDYDTYSRSYSQLPITYEYIYIYVHMLYIYSYVIYIYIHMFYIYIYTRKYTSMSTNGNCSVIWKRKLDKESKVKQRIRDDGVQFDINSEIHLDCSTGELK